MSLVEVKKCSCGWAMHTLVYRDGYPIRRSSPIFCPKCKKPLP
jgi:hypothetical protein